MLKKGWHSLKGMIIIFIIGLVIVNAMGFYFGNFFTGSVVAGVGGRISIDVGQEMYIDGKLLELKLVSPNTVKVLVGGVEGLISKDNTEIINGLQIKVLDVTDKEVGDSAVLFVKRFEENVLSVEDGKYELRFSQKMIINGHVVSVLPVDSENVLFKVGDVNEELAVSQSVNIDGLVITLNDVKDFIGDEFDAVDFFAVEGSGRLDCWGCDRFDLAYGDSVIVFNKELTFRGIDDELITFIVDGKVKTLRLKDYTDINGLQLYAESFKNSEDVYLDRVNVLVREVLF